ncbi:ankyrin repeat domain-containing protein [Paeniroseomonas aquatica]|uniref:Ankyrin repeat domain-containing protein n=1 Tax=Paeniroseomonas aquatica TaxID=373043 RepID=A0ABT8AD97_9PROT|nr:ankyrin repeat domain-containing protein [Paeniroseomonas aquatica]MDN3567818.1 ankyrin repeat domain-containing protein [Paeniroseomonas aquatica]
MRRIAPTVPPLALLAALLLPVPEAAAQFRGGGGGGMGPPPTDGAATRPPPAALPGLQYRQAPAPIPADPTQNLSPNAALFDAINRGDLPAAREAVGRGADIEARNVLGLTAVDAAVDQGRNEIMFFGISARGSSRRGPPPAAEPEPPAPPPGRRNAAARPATGPQAERSLPAAPHQVANPRLWAGDGGAPQPQIGFLGFDAGRPEGAQPPTAFAPSPRPGRAGRG